MNTIHWFETKQLDRVTNYSSRTECITNTLSFGGTIYYYCSFAKYKEYYGLNNNISYLGRCKNKYIKYLEFHFLIILKALQVVLHSDSDILMCNQDLVNYLKPAIYLNKILGKNNKFVLDVRTLPTVPETFEKDMQKYQKQIKQSLKTFDGLSFITPFLEKVSLSENIGKKPTVHWSSGVDVDLFNADKFDYARDTKAFRLFYHGGISHSRGNMDLIKACEIVKQKGYQIELVQIGKIVDKDLKAYISEKGIESWCKLYEARPLSEMPAMVAKCDLPVLPFPNFMAWRVSSPIKLMEYLAMGKPVLAPDMECFTDILDKNSGMVYYYDMNKNEVPSEIANAIIKIIEQRSNKNEFIKNKDCIDYVKDKFTWKTQAYNLYQFCNALCQKVK